MTTTYTIDASVFINAFNSAEAGYADSQRLLAQLRSQAAPLIAPTLLLPEVAAAGSGVGPTGRGGGRPVVFTRQ